MRIFYAVGSRPNQGLGESKIWYYNLFLPLIDLGHQVIPLDYNLEPHYAHTNLERADCKEFNEQNQTKLEGALLRQISETHRKERIDLFFSYFYSSFVRPEVIKEIHRMGIKTINWFCNASYQFDLVKDIAPAYDYCLVPEKFRLQDYLLVGANPIYCQEAANPAIYKPYTLPYLYDVTFIGAQYADRAEYVKYLLDHKIAIRVWGPMWLKLCTSKNLVQQLNDKFRSLKRRLKGKKLDNPPNLPSSIYGGNLTDEEMIQMYSSSRISLGFSKVGCTHLDDLPIKQVRLRDFEAPMSGAFYMAEYVEELEDFFIPDKEVVMFYDKNDLLDKVKYYLAHDDHREKIRKAGHLRALNDHSWQKRLKFVFNQIGCE